MVVVIVMLVVWGFITYLIILGGSKYKTDYERKMEDEEQMRYLSEYQKKKQEKSAFSIHK